MSRGPVPASGRSSAFFAAAALALAAIIPALGMPVYFRTDDVEWLGWAAGHPNPLAAFIPGQNLFGYYRPLPALAWWALYRVFGFNPLGYQLALALVAVLAMVPLFSIGRRLGGGVIGIAKGAAGIAGERHPAWAGFLAVFLFHAAFFSILYYVYWFSALTFGLELLFLLWALDAFIDRPVGRTSFPGRRVKFVILALAAGLSKQPALIAIPVVTTALFWSNRKSEAVPADRNAGDGKRRNAPAFAWGARIWSASILLLLATPLVERYVTPGQGMMSETAARESARFLMERYAFYARLLLRSPAGAIAAAAAAGSVGRRIGGTMKSGWIFAGAGGLAGVALGLAPSIGFPVWLALLGLAAWAEPASRPWAIGFAALFALLGAVEMYVATYLLEPAALLVPALVVWAAPLVRPAGDRASALVDAHLPRATAVAIPVLLAAGVIAAAYPRIPAVSTMRDVRTTFREAVDDLIDTAPRNATIGSPDYDELDESYAGIRERPLGVRVARLKTMDDMQLDRFLRLRGRPDLKVVSLRKAMSAAEPRLVLALSEEERAAIARKLPGAREIRAFRRNGAVSSIYAWQ